MKVIQNELLKKMDQLLGKEDRNKGIFLKKFRPIAGGDLYEQWSSLEQTSTTAEYIRKFIELAAPLDGVSEQVALGCFIKGLKTQIKNELRIWAPDNLNRAMDLAQQIEEKNRSIRSSGFGALATRNSTLTLSRTIPTQNYFPQNIPNRSIGGIRREGAVEDRQLTESQLIDKRARGICYRCDEKWHRGHKCKAQVNVILIEDDEEETADDQKGEQEAEEGNQSAPNLDSYEVEAPIEVSLNSVAGLSSPKTMKLKGRIKEQPVVTLIDPGATHNFISSSLVTKLGLPLHNTVPYIVRVGTGDREGTRGVCLGMLLHLPGIDVVEEFIPMRLGSADVILGIKWLETLGTIETNWKRKTMEFEIGGKWVKLQGDPTLGTSLVSLKSLERELRRERQGVLVEFSNTEVEGGTRSIPEFLQQVLGRFQDIFREPTGLPPPRHLEHQIILKDGSAPVNVRPYRYPHFQKDEIERMIRDMLTAGIIQSSTSPYSSPVILVKKKDGSWRFCVDYRALNRATVPDKFPIPVIDELLDELHGSVVFSKLDLRSGYHQIRVRKEDVPKTAFRTHDGHYEFKVMPFGLTNAPATFQSLMNDVFRSYLRKFILVFFDDILIYSKSEELHKEHLTKALETLQHHRLFLNWKKCEFGQERLSYLGHEVSSQGVAAEKDKVQAMLDWPSPKNIKALRGFLGLTGYYRKFVKNYANIAAPLTAQLKKDRYGWNHEAEEAFNRLKIAMTQVPVLAMPDFTKPFMVETDASGFGLGAVLMQENRPVAYFSQTLGSQARLKSIYEKELMAIVKAVLKWRPYLIGRRFVVRTDQLSLKFILEQRVIGSEYQRWISKLLGFSFDIEYRTGASNRVADALSRKEVEAECDSMEVGYWRFWEDLKKELENDELVLKIKRELAEEPTAHKGFTLYQGNLLFKGRLVIPEKSSFINDIIHEFHDSPIGGHSGRNKTYQRLTSEVYWPGMKSAVEKYVRDCPTCLKNKIVNMSPAGLIQPIPIPTQTWDELTMDFIEGLPRSDGWDTIWVVVDRLTKYAHFITLRHPFTAATVATSFMKEIVRLHGLPTSIISDRDRVFLSQFWTELFRLHGVELKRSTAYHPQTDGQSEVVNRCLETYLRCFCSEKPKQWARWLPWAEYWYNTSFHTATKHTPFKALYGRDPPPLIRYEGQYTPVDAIDQQLEERDAIIDDLRMNLLRAQQKMQVQADKTRRDVNYGEGEWVYVKIRPYRQKSLAKRRYEKLAPRFYGPYKITAKVGKLAYKLDLPTDTRVHPVFHVSQLKSTTITPSKISALPPQLNKELEMIVEPEALKGVREKKGSSTQEWEVLIQWVGLTEEEATWEDYQKMVEQFPDFHLEDKVKVWGAGGDRAQPLLVYQRRNQTRGNL